MENLKLDGEKKSGFVVSTVRTIGIKDSDIKDHDLKGAIANFSFGPVNYVKYLFEDKALLLKKSDVVPFSAVVDMHRNYKGKLGDVIVGKHPTIQNEVRLVKAFNIDKIDLTTMLDPTTINPTYIVPTSFVVLLGVKQELGHKEYSNTLIIAGVDSSNNIIQELAIEYCLPCPDVCPVNIDTI